MAFSLPPDKAGSLWIGGLESHMNEEFIVRAFEMMGERCTHVKLIKNKFTGEPAGYGFVHFPDDKMALEVMHKLNGKIMPYTQPPLRFKLNHSMAQKPTSSNDFSLWVGDLSPDVDDYLLYKTFATRYQHIYSAKVVLDQQGISKGYGFVRIHSEEEYRDALIHMSGYSGLGSRPLKVSHAIPKGYTAASTGFSLTTLTAVGSDAEKAAAAANYWTYQHYQSYPTAGQGVPQVTSVLPQAPSTEQAPNAASSYVTPNLEEDDYQVVEWDVPVDVEKLNREFMDRNQELWEALEDSRWSPIKDLETMGVY
ncbi:tRNA selenocysteine 1-associated protein 1-like [Artemia franciscana]|uniref:tRNA selenocysteine-associated protein 1 n=1 Tax=Artemia franciscana TaxID=6661 RepID=A0AA88L1U5_ARTSF|nr:hypothetical protein QYM36_016825 [Artemia franciscana]